AQAAPARSLFAAEQGLHGVAREWAAPLRLLQWRRSRRKNKRAATRRNRLDPRSRRHFEFIKNPSSRRRCPLAHYQLAFSVSAQCGDAAEDAINPAKQGNKGAFP